MTKQYKIGDVLETQQEACAVYALGNGIVLEDEGGHKRKCDKETVFYWAYWRNDYKGAWVETTSIGDAPFTIVKDPGKPKPKRLETLEEVMACDRVIITITPESRAFNPSVRIHADYGWHTSDIVIADLALRYGWPIVEVTE
jgi:hypothetical protein